MGCIVSCICSLLCELYNLFCSALFYSALFYSALLAALTTLHTGSNFAIESEDLSGGNSDIDYLDADRIETACVVAVQVSNERRKTII